MKWRVCWFILASIIHSKSHPIEELENVRDRRAAEECCPCPKPGARAASIESPAGACPCLPADSEGAPSILTQTALRAASSFLRPETKEEVKPLLHPEVDLASSVLNTLKEATEEEYHEALARDAARSMARETEDEEPATNIINIIVSPESTFNNENLDNEKDALPDASHVQETRCLPSLLGRTNSKVTARKPPSLSKHIFGLESKPLGILHKNALDVDNAASTIHEHVLESVNNGLKGLKLRSNPSLLNLFPNESEETPKSILNNFMSVPKLRDNDKMVNSKTKAVNLKNNQNTFDPKTAASNINENVLKILNREKPDFFKLKPIVKASDKTFKNIIKLKDVELLPPKKVTLPRLKLPDLKLPLIPVQRKSHTTGRGDKSGGSDKEECTENIKDQDPKSNIQTISKRIVHTEIVDAMPSPSENQNVFANNSGETDLSSDEAKDEKEFNDINQNEQLISPSNKETNSAEFELLNNLNKDEFVINSQSENIGEQSAEDVESQESQLKKVSITDGECVEAENNLENIKKEPKASVNPLSKIASFHDDFIKKLKPQRNEKTFGTKSSPSTLNNNAQGATSSNNEDNCNDASVLQPVSLKQGLEDETESITSMPSDPVSFKDLQAMSDSLLDASMTKEKTSPSPTCTADAMILKDSSIESSEEFIDNQDERVDKGKILKPFNIDSNEILSSDDKEHSKSLLQHESKGSDLNNNVEEVDPCVKITTTTTLSPLLQERNRDDCLKKEMEVAASDPISDTVSRLFPSAKTSNNFFGPSNILQPSSLINGGELDFLRPVDIGNILNFNTQLPTLEELRSRVSSLLGMGINLTPAERRTDFFSSELESDFTNTSPVISRDAFEPFSSLPSLGPLDDLNIDIFQVKPLGMSPGTKLSIPGFGLNSIKAKLPIPKSVDLKPLRLESRVGNKKDGMLGSVLTFGPSRLGSKKNNNSRDILNSPSNLIESLTSSTPKQSLPSLHNVRSNLRKDAQKLISSSSGVLPLSSRLPLRKKENSLLKLPTNDITANFRAQSDKAVKHLQQTMDSTFKNSNGLSSSLPKPEHILGIVSQAHDDINNKLEDLHSDLNNQITSFRNNVLKDTTPKISPVLGKTRTFSKLDFPRTHTQVIESLPKGFKTKKPQAKAKSSSIRTVDRMNRLSTAASVPVPKTVAVPKLKKSEDAPLRIRESVLKSNMDSIKPLMERKRLSDITRGRGAEPKKDHLIRPYKPLGEFKVSFGKTTTTTTTARTPLFKKTIAVPTTTKKPSLLKSRLNLPNLPQTPRDSFKLSRKHPHSSDASVSPSSTVLSRSSLSNQSDKVVPKKVKQTQAKTQKDLLKETEPGKLVWPKLDDNSFLSKVREAVKTRLANLRNPKAEVILPQARSGTRSDMSLGASEVVERKTALKSNAPLKENVAYKCKLVCVKEVINSDENNKT